MVAELILEDLNVNASMLYMGYDTLGIWERKDVFYLYLLLGLQVLVESTYDLGL